MLGFYIFTRAHSVIDYTIFCNVIVFLLLFVFMFANEYKKRLLANLLRFVFGPTYHSGISHCSSLHPNPEVASSTALKENELLTVNST